MAKQLAFYFDASACAKCKTCAVACKDKNNLPVGINYRRVYQYGSGSWVPMDGVLVPNNVYSYSVSISCMHCINPPCVEVCPTGAMHKRDDGVVLINPEICVGCRYCQWACPYGAPQFHEDKGVMGKCNFCEDLLAKGQNPICVDACNMRAIKFGDLQELRAQYGTVDAIEPLPSGNISSPSVVITPHKHAQRSGTGTGRVTLMPEEL